MANEATHALKGAASNVGAEALSDACFALEQSCLQGQWPADGGFWRYFGNHQTLAHQARQVAVRQHGHAVAQFGAVQRKHHP